MGANTRLIVPLLAAPLLLLVLGAGALAQSAALVRVKITVVKATGTAAEGIKPAVPPDLDAVKDVLTKLGYDRYQYLMAPESTGAARAAFGFKKLPEGLAATIKWEDHAEPGGDLRVQVTVDKPATEPENERVKLAALTARLRDGASFLVKCPKVYADGDLLLVITATRVKR